MQNTRDGQRYGAAYGRIRTCIRDSTKAKQYVKKAIYFNHLGGSVVFPFPYVIVRESCSGISLADAMWPETGQTDIFSFHTIETSSWYLRTISIPITIEWSIYIVPENQYHPHPHIFDWILAGAVENLKCVVVGSQEIIVHYFNRNKSNILRNGFKLCTVYAQRAHNNMNGESSVWCYVSLLFALQRKQFWCKNKRHRFSGNARQRTKIVDAKQGEIG